MYPHNDERMRPYFDSPHIAPLSADQLDRLRRKLAPAAVRYTAYDVTSDKLVDAELFVDADEAAQASEIGHVATVLIPLSPSP